MRQSFEIDVRRRGPGRTTRTLVVVACVVVSLLGCDDEEECQALTDRIQQRVDALPSGAGAQVPEGLDAPEGVGEPLPYDVPVVAIAADGALSLNGERVEAPDGLGDALREENRLRQRVSMEAYGTAVHVWADRSLPLAQVQSALASLQGYEGWLLVTSPPTEAPPPCPERLGEVCDPPADPATRAAVLADAVTPLVEDCDALTRLFTRLATLSATEKEAAFRRGFAPAVRQCDCDLDMPAIEYLVVVLGGGLGERTTRIRLTGTSEGTVGDWVSARAER